jgi:hypothetical protein
METPAIPHGSGGGVPMWVWLAVGVIVLVALSSRSSAGATQPTILNTGPSDSTNELQRTQLEAQTAIGLQLINVAGATDIARIQARSQEIYGYQSLAAIDAQARGAAAVADAGQPKPPVTINVYRQAQAQTNTLSRNAALAARNVRTARASFVKDVAGALGDGVVYARGLL